MSAMVFGTNALIVKPAISLAPMLVVNILNSYGYNHLHTGAPSTPPGGPNMPPGGPTPTPALTPGQLAALQDVMFTIMCLFPVVVGIVQLASWSMYTRRGSMRKHAEIDIEV
jgi:Na+/melibiose symporter-like transporter